MRDTSREVDVVIGTRPEAIKMAPVAHELRRRGVGVRLILSGQHEVLVKELLGPLKLVDFEFVNLAVMQDRQSLNGLTSRLFMALNDEYRHGRPTLTLVQGDTTTAFCAALAAFYEGIPVAHVEAGLRSGNHDDPFPEEMNRILISRIAKIHFPPTIEAATNLVQEGVTRESIVVTGNTVIDSLHWIRNQKIGSDAFPASPSKCKVLVTMHRRENQGLRMKDIAQVLVDLAEELDLNVVVPVHPNPAVQDVIRPVLLQSERMTVLEPLNYIDFVATLASADIVVTDSGGVQEEAPALGTATLVIRNTTERPEAISSGCARLIGTDPSSLRKHLTELVSSPSVRKEMVKNGSPFGDGRAAGRIVDYLIGFFEQMNPKD